eukprot:391558_1
MSDFISLQPEFKDGMKVWCSTLKRCVETAKPFCVNDSTSILKWRALCEIEAGICDSMTYEQVKSRYPNEYKARKENKLIYRYPQGESYKDVIARLEPVIFELERATRPVLVVAHQAVLRCLYGYFLDRPLEDVPYTNIDLHTVYKLTPTDYSTETDKFTFGVSSKPTGSVNIGDVNFNDNISDTSLSTFYLPTSYRSKLKIATKMQEKHHHHAHIKKNRGRSHSNGNFQKIYNGSPRPQSAQSPKHQHPSTSNGHAHLSKSRPSIDDKDDGDKKENK